MLRAESVSHSFVSTRGKPIRVLENISISVPKGDVVAIVGPSGSGKTTLLKVIAGLIEPEEGVIEIDGKKPKEALKDQSISLMFQRPVLFPWRTVRENVGLQAELHDWPEKSLRVERCLKAVQLIEFADAYPHELSGGMQSRVEIARALLSKPALLLMDEPFGSLDAITRSKVQDELVEIVGGSGMTVVLVTHSIEEAVFLSNRVIVTSQRPATSLGEVAVDLGPLNQRKQNIRREPAFNALSMKVEQILWSKNNHL